MFKIMQKSLIVLDQEKLVSKDTNAFLKGSN